MNVNLTTATCAGAQPDWEDLESEFGSADQFQPPLDEFMREMRAYAKHVISTWTHPPAGSALKRYVMPSDSDNKDTIRQ
jgi:hypothetical protein